MPSAFRRAGAQSVSSRTSSKSSGPSLLGARGVKPWTGGIHLTSVGLNDLDSILGGGQPLGTCILMQEDRWTRDLALSLVRYWVAEALSQEQGLIIPVSKNDPANDDISESLELVDVSFYASELELQDLLLALPRNLHWDKHKQKEKMRHTSETPRSLDILEEGGEEEDAEEGLEIAWQYKKSVQEERLALQSTQPGASAHAANVFCHSYDLSGRMADQVPLSLASFLVEVPDSCSSEVNVQSKGISMYRDLVGLVKGMDRNVAARLLLFHPSLDPLVVALPLIMTYIRAHSLAVVVLVCIPPTVDMKSWSNLGRAADVVLSTEGFASRKEYPQPPEFRHLQGLLSVAKVSTVTAATANGGGHFGDLTISKRPVAVIYGFKRDRRKLHIPLLHIPPEDYAEGGGSVGSGVRSGAGKVAETKKKVGGGGMGCSSNMSGSVLDF